jgi:nitrogen fixation NifU-like protein
MSGEADELRERALEELRKVYSDTVIDHAMNPRNLGDTQNADGYARVTGPCGDTMEIWLVVKGNNIFRATFETDGCGTTLAAGSMITEMVRGRQISEAFVITSNDLLDALGGFPVESEHCALLAVNTMVAAINDYRAMQREPWKKAYRK